jgi:alpha-L-rhamnosidase
VAWTLADGTLTVTALVPPGTSAEVLLPDGPRADVGAGEHTWELPWAPAARPLPRHDLDSDIADLVDDPEALQLVRSVLAEHDPGRAQGFAGAIRYEAGVPLRTTLMFAAPSTFAAVESALADLNARR